MIDVDKIVDSLCKASALMVLNDQKEQKLKQIQESKANNCGNCRFWMTKGCEKEQKSGRIMSCNDSCSKCQWVDKGNLVDILTKELEEINAKIDKFYN